MMLIDYHTWDCICLSEVAPKLPVFRTMGEVDAARMLTGFEKREHEM